MPLLALVAFSTTPSGHPRQHPQQQQVIKDVTTTATIIPSVAQARPVPNPYWKDKERMAHARYVHEVKARRAAARARARSIQSDSAAWADTSDAIKVANCESGGPRDATTYQGWVHDTGNPSYRGKWQIGYSEWASEGGTGDPAAASESEQDYRAWKLWKARGWEPWTCASIMGVS